MSLELNPFDLDAISSRMEQFAERIPFLLSEHTTTADLSLGLDGLLEQADRPFTVAVVGQMRVGKSTLLNALVGQDLAITGVNETTATLNWLKYGEGDLLDRFRVVWKDQPEELLPREQLREWVGDSDKAKATSFLEFFADSEVLKEANFVDTPGMRSVIDSHEETINEFLSTKWDKESQAQGGKADAIVYVFPGTARIADQGRLEDFADSKIPGSSPMNSIGVIHKWDALNEEHPFDVIQSKAEQLASQMEGLVSEVIPISAPLFIAADRYDENFWSRLSECLTLEEEDFEDLLMDEADFRELEVDQFSFSVQCRKAFRSDYPMPWSSLCLILRHASALGLKAPEAIRAEILLRSGIPHLQKQLRRRFFVRSRLIKMMSIVSRAWDPCSKAVIRLRNEKLATSAVKDKLPDFVNAVREAPSINAEHGTLMNEAADFLEQRSVDLEVALERASAMLRKIDHSMAEVREFHDDIDLDWQCIELLEGDASSVFSETVRFNLLSVFGYNGPSFEERIAPWLRIQDTEDRIKEMEQFLDDLLQQRETVRFSRLLNHAECRLDQILNILEQQQNPLR